jgi:hypothetical protein
VAELKTHFQDFNDKYEKITWKTSVRIPGHWVEDSSLPTSEYNPRVLLQQPDI